MMKKIIIGFNSTGCKKKQNFGYINIVHLNNIVNKLNQLNQEDYSIAVLSI